MHELQPLFPPRCRTRIKTCVPCRKKLCGALQRTFTDPGQPGEMFSGVFRALTDRLKQPENEREGEAAEKFFKDGHRCILPSFFELLMHLQVWAHYCCHVGCTAAALLSFGVLSMRLHQNVHSCSCKQECRAKKSHSHATVTDTAVYSATGLSCCLGIYTYIYIYTSLFYTLSYIH